MLVNLNGVRYSYEITGEGETLLLFHGFTGSKQTWDPFINEWSKSFQVLSIDLLGHGETDSPNDPNRYTIENACKDIQTLLDQLNITQIYLLGYSMGGRLALSFTCLYPRYVKKLILESSSPGLKTLLEREERVKSDEKLVQMISKQGLKEFINYWERIPLFQSQQVLSETRKKVIRKERENQNPIGLMNSLKGMGTGAQQSWWEQLHNINIPVLLLVGEFDKKFCTIAEEMKESIPQSRLIKINGAGHAIHVEQAEKFGKIVEEFLLDT